jgi:hypothetical protein
VETRERRLDWGGAAAPPYDSADIFWSDHMPRRVAPQGMKIEDEDEKEDEDDFLVSKRQNE